MINNIGAIVLAAGLSRRMGKPKMLLPWGSGTVIEHVVGVCSHTLTETIVVCGQYFQEISVLTQGKYVKVVYNENYANGEMLDSLRKGLTEISTEIEAAFIVLGDQPFIQAPLLEKIINQFYQSKRKILIPSYQMRRGHPWLVHKELLSEFWKLPPGETMRDFLKLHQSEIEYCEVNDQSILLDIDTPEDYEKYKP